MSTYNPHAIQSIDDIVRLAQDGFENWQEYVDSGDIKVYDKQVLLRENDFTSSLDILLEELEDGDYDREIFLDHVLGLETGSLRTILEILRRTYCGTFAIEFMQISDPAQKLWLQQRIEGELPALREHVRRGRFAEAVSLAEELDLDPVQLLIEHRQRRLRAQLGELELVVDLASAVGTLRHGRPLAVRAVVLRQPYLHARVLEDGRASWDILKAVQETAGEGPADAGEPAVAVRLDRLELDGGRVAWDDHRSGLSARLLGIDHTLEGDLSARRFDLDTRTTVDSATIRGGGITYLSGARLEADIELEADTEAGVYELRQNRVALNELAVALDGTVRRTDDGAELDLTFDADTAGLRDLLSLVPAFFESDFERLEADGRAVVRGFARGPVGPEILPTFSVQVDLSDGRFKYADLPVPVTDVDLDLMLSSPGGPPDAIRLDLERLAFRLGEHPFFAALVLTTPVSDPELSATVEGTIDLDAAGRAIKLDGIEELSGRLDADAGDGIPYEADFASAPRAGIETGAEAGRVTGFTGCNDFGAGYAATAQYSDGGSLRIFDFSATEIACGDLRGDVERAFVEGMLNAGAYEMEGSILRILPSPASSLPVIVIELVRI